MKEPPGAARSPAVSFCTPVSSQASTPLSKDAASPFPADDVVKPRRPAPIRLAPVIAAAPAPASVVKACLNYWWRPSRKALKADVVEATPMDVLHVGNSFSKDFVGARDAGMRAVLLDRFGRENHGDELSAEGARWREAGAPVVRDLSDVLEHVARSDFALGCSG